MKALMLNESSGFAPALGVTNLQMPDDKLVVICFDTLQMFKKPTSGPAV